MPELNEPDLAAFFRKQASWYDWRARLTYAIGFRDWAYRRRAVDALALASGDTVVEIGCGTGRNFELLERAVGPSGLIIGVDLSDAMLAQARRRAIRRGWSNVTLVESDAGSYQLPASVNGVLSTYTLVVVPGYDLTIQRSAAALPEGGRCVVLDQKLPSGWSRRLVPLLDLASRPFEYSRLVGERRVWESIGEHMGNLRLEEFYFGFVYLAVGEKRGPRPRD